MEGVQTGKSEGMVEKHVSVKFFENDDCLVDGISNIEVNTPANVNLRIDKTSGAQSIQFMTVQDGPADVDDTTPAIITEILDHVQNCPAVFKTQQIGDPELTVEDKRSLAENLIKNNPSNFLVRFGPFLSEHHFEYFSSINNPEIIEQARQIRMAYHHNNKKVQQKNRRYEALKRLEAEGSYFSEAEMEKREPLLYHELVGQFLTEKEKLIKEMQNNSNVIPTFSNFLIHKMERDEITALRKLQQERENDYEMSEDEDSVEPVKNPCPPRWGDDWIDAENALKQKKKKPKKQKPHLSCKEKALLLAEFKSLMHTKFLNGLESEFNYDDVDLNPDYDSLQTRSQDEEDKYFDEESCDGNVCTDTGIEDY